MIKKIIQKIRCSMPFSLNYFWHKNIIVVRKLSDQSQLIQCRDCGKLFAINHSVRIVLPWEDVKVHYDFMESLEEGTKAMERIKTKNGTVWPDPTCDDYQSLSWRLRYAQESPTKSIRILKISRCIQCPNCIRSINTCTMSNKIIDVDADKDIPDWCLLEQSTIEGNITYDSQP